MLNSEKERKGVGNEGKEAKVSGRHEKESKEVTQVSQRDRATPHNLRKRASRSDTRSTNSSMSLWSVGTRSKNWVWSRSCRSSPRPCWRTWRRSRTTTSRPCRIITAFTAPMSRSRCTTYFRHPRSRCVRATARSLQ